LTGSVHDPGVLLSIERTEELKNAFTKRMQSEEVSHREWYARQRNEMVHHVRVLTLEAGALEVILFSNIDEYIGAARTRADLMLANPLRTWEFVGNDLMIATENLGSGLCLELNNYTRGGDYVKDGVYELTTWGAFASTADHSNVPAP